MVQKEGCGAEVGLRGVCGPGLRNKAQGHLRQARLVSRNSLGPVLREGPKVTGIIWVWWSST